MLMMSSREATRATSTLRMNLHGRSTCALKIWAPLQAQWTDETHLPSRYRRTRHPARRRRLLLLAAHGFKAAAGRLCPRQWPHRGGRDRHRHEDAGPDQGDPGQRRRLRDRGPGSGPHGHRATARPSAARPRRNCSVRPSASTRPRKAWSPSARPNDGRRKRWSRSARPSSTPRSRKLARSEQLAKTNAVSQQVLDDDRAATHGAQAAVAAAQAQVAASEAAISAAKAQVVDAERSR